MLFKKSLISFFLVFFSLGIHVSSADSIDSGNIIEAARAGDLNLVKGILARNEADLGDCSGALIAAVKSNQVNAAALILKSKPQVVNMQSISGTSALQLAVSEGSAPLVSLLLQSGALINAKTSNGNLTAIQIAENLGHKEILAMLKKAQQAQAKSQTLQ